MPRNGSGTYTLPEQPFTPGTTILSAAVNDDFSDIALALTGSVAADGQTSMTGPLKLAAGSAAAPSLTFASDPTKGLFSSGTDQIGVAVAGALVAYFTTMGLVNPSGSPVGLPIGAVVDYTIGTIPPGFIYPAGQNVSRTTYAALFVLWGTYYGSGDGVTTFGVPNLRGRVAAGRDDMGGTPAGRITAGVSGINGVALGAVGGSQAATLSTSNLAAHGHNFSGTTSGESTPHTHSSQKGASSIQGTIGAGSSFFNAQTGDTTGADSNDHTHNYSGTTDSNGSGQPFSVVQPTMILNKLIYAGV